MINWGGLQGGGFQNALAQGLQMGQMAGAAKRERDIQNALAQYDPSNPETLKPIMKADARLGVQLRGQYDQQASAQARARAEADLTTRALNGDKTALTELATINFEKFKTLDKRQQDAIAAESKMFGEAALNLSQIPYEQRRDMILAYAQQMPQYADKINEIAFLPQAEQDRMLQVAITEAGLVQEMLRMNEPRYQVVPEASTLVNTRDPSAVQQFQQGGGAGGFVEGQTATNPQTGRRIVFRNGAWRPM